MCFLREKVQYLGHVISKRGILPDPGKTQKVCEFSTPTDVTRIHQFWGLASYFRRFVPGFAHIANPMHALTKKDVPFEWTEHCQVAFEQLEDLLTTVPHLSLSYFGPGEEFVLETDASLGRLGAVLSQRQDDGHVHPIVYASRSLQPHECNYTVTELETLGVVWASEQFRHYLLGHHCLLLNDHSACTSLLNASRPLAKLGYDNSGAQSGDLIPPRKDQLECGCLVAEPKVCGGITHWRSHSAVCEWSGNQWPV